MGPENKIKEYKIASGLLLFLGALDIVMMFTNSIGGEYDLSGEPRALQITMYAFAALIWLIIAAKLYMGIKGLMYCNGKGSGRGHIRVAKIFIAIAAIALLLSLIEVIAHNGGIDTIASDLCDLIIICWYFNLAKLHEGR